MDYLFTFIEGIASFISPCVLPMLPIYISYFIGEDNKKVSKAVINSIGGIISNNIKYVKILFGIIIILLGLNYMEILKIKLLNKTKGINKKVKDLNFFKALIFGMLFSISWTPCIGTFLASALLLIAKNQDMVKGILLMLIYSAGLGIPFIISAVLLEKLKEVFNFVKKHYDIIKKISGVILIIMGIYMIFF